MEHRGKHCLDEKEIRKDLDDIFSKFDKNGDGVLEKEELTQMLKALSRKHNQKKDPALMEEYMANFMAKADTNSDGRIDK